MKPYVRPFQKDVYDEVDTPSKQALIKVLLSEGHKIVSSKEDYYADVVSERMELLIIMRQNVKHSGVRII